MQTVCDFNLVSHDRLLTFSTICVEGPEFATPHSTLTSRPSTSLSSTSWRPSGPVPPVFRSIVSSRKGSAASVNLTLIYASMERGPLGKPHFVPLSQTYLEVTEKTARVSDIADHVQNSWGEDVGGDELVLVTADGLRLEDSEGTRGQSILQYGMHAN